MNVKCSIVWITMMGVLVGLGQVSAQRLTIGEAIERTIMTYPSVQQAEEAMKRAEYNVSMARAVYYPMIQGSAGYTRSEPKEEISFDGMNLDFAANNLYNAQVSLRQLVYGFGKNVPGVRAAEVRHQIAEYDRIEILQSLALNTVRLYYLVSFARQAIKIKQQELADHDEMLRQVALRTESGSATEYDLLNTQVSRSIVQSQLTGLNANHSTLQVQFSVLLDSLIDERVLLDSITSYQLELPGLEDLLQEAYRSRPEMIIAEKEISVAMYGVQTARRAYNPNLELDANLGGKNGYMMTLARMRFFWNAGVTLSVPIFDGNRRHQSLNLAKSSYNSALLQQESIKKQVTNGVSEVYFTLLSDIDKMKEFEQQVNLAQRAYDQAIVNYNAGSITNLELITSSTNLSTSKLMLLQAQINCVIDRYRLDMSIGKTIWK